MGCAKKAEETSVSDANAETSLDCDSSSQGDGVGGDEAADKDNAASGEEVVNYKADPNGTCVDPNGFCIKLLKEKNHFYEYYFYHDESCVMYIAITAYNIS